MHEDIAPESIRGEILANLGAEVDKREGGFAADMAAPVALELWKLYDSQGRFLRDEGCRLGSVAGSWLHCYPEGSRRFWRAWLRTCASYFSDQRP